jgi:hypothetical protein
MSDDYMEKCAMAFEHALVEHNATFISSGSIEVRQVVRSVIRAVLEAGRLSECPEAVEVAGEIHRDVDGWALTCRPGQEHSIRGRHILRAAEDAVLGEKIQPPAARVCRDTGTHDWHPAGIGRRPCRRCGVMGPKDVLGKETP